MTGIRMMKNVYCISAGQPEQHRQLLKLRRR